MKKKGLKFRHPGSRAALLLVGGAVALCLLQHSTGGARTMALDAAGCTTVSDMAAAAALHALQQAAQLEQAAWCSEHGAQPEAGQAYKRATAKLPGNESTTLPMWVLSKADTVSSYISKDGLWEPAESRAFLRHLAAFAQERGLQPQDVYMLDIGANMGWHGLMAALAGHRVLAFEPMEGNLGALRRTLCETPALLQRYTLVPKGLGNAQQRCAFLASQNNNGNGFTACGSTERIASQDGLRVNTWGKLVRVGEFDLDRLDSILGAASLALRGRIGLIKIDVEGHEEQVYQGATCFLRAAQPEFIFAEVNGPALVLSEGRKTPEGMLQLYTELGFDIRRGGFNGPIQPPSDFSKLVNQSAANSREANFWLTRRRQGTEGQLLRRRGAV